MPATSSEALMAQAASGLPDAAVHLHLVPPVPRDEAARVKAVAAGFTPNAQWVMVLKKEGH